MPYSSSYISSFRSRLRYSYPDSEAIQALTISDLSPQGNQEIKWSIKQRILITIFENSILLKDSHEFMLNLLEEKNNQAIEWRKSSRAVDKDVKIEYERRYRTDFMRLVLQSLELLKWPPALEAFSDPMQDLLSSTDTWFNAVEFLLSILGKKSLGTDVHSGSNIVQSQDDPVEDVSIGGSGTKVRMKTPDSKPVKSLPSQVVMSSPLPSADNSHSSHLNIPAQDAPSSFAANTSYYAQQRDIAISPSNLSSDFPVSNSKPITLQTYEALLFQNEVLRTQIRQLQENFRRRQEVEATVSAVLSDVTAAVREITEVGVSGATPLGGKSSSEATQAQKPLPGWRGVLTKLTALQGQWQDALRQSKEIPQQKCHPPSAFYASRSADKASKWAQSQAFGHDLSLHSAGSQERPKLQRELAAFASVLGEVMEPSRAAGSSSVSGAMEWTTHIQALQELQYSAQKLGLYLACETPIQSEESTDTGKNSGINTLIKLVHGEIMPKIKSKSLQQELQVAMDRAQQETSALVRTTNGLTRMVTRWNDLAKDVVTKVTIFGKKVVRSIDERAAALNDSCAAVGQVLKAFYKAKEARLASKVTLSAAAAAAAGAPMSARSYSGSAVDDEVRSTASGRNSATSSTSSTATFAPLDALCRGVAGEDVATLINALRLNHSQMLQLEDLVSEFTSGLSKELRAEQLELLTFVKRSVAANGITIEHADSTEDQLYNKGDGSTNRRVSGSRGSATPLSSASAGLSTNSKAAVAASASKRAK